MVTFCEKFGGILLKYLWNFKRSSMIFWKNISEVLGVNFDEILKKMCWNIEKSLVKSRETFGEILEKNWWSFRENLGKSWKQFGQKLWKKLIEIWTIQWNFEENLMKLCNQPFEGEHLTCIKMRLPALRTRFW